MNVLSGQTPKSDKCDGFRVIVAIKHVCHTSLFLRQCVTCVTRISTGYGTFGDKGACVGGGVYQNSFSLFSSFYSASRTQAPLSHFEFAGQVSA